MYEVAVPQNIPAEVYSKRTFTEEDAANIEETAAEMMQLLTTTAATVIDATSNKLLRKIAYHSYRYESLLLRAAGEITAINGVRVELKPCANGQLCVSQYVRGFETEILMGWLRHQEWLVLVTCGIDSCGTTRPCILCVRNQFTKRKMEHYLHQKSKTERRVTEEGQTLPPLELQPFYNACNPDDSETYRVDRLMKVGDFPMSLTTGYADLELPMVCFNKDDYYWEVEDGVWRVNQSAIRSGASQSMQADEGIFLAPPGPPPPHAGNGGQGDGGYKGAGGGGGAGGKRQSVPGPFTLGHSRPGGASDEVSTAQQPAAQLARICSSFYGKDVREICFSASLVHCAETCKALDDIDPGEAFGYTSWFDRGGRLETLSKTNPYVRLLCVRLLIFNLLRVVQDRDLGYWLHLFIDQHMPFLALVMQKDEIAREDVVEPLAVEPICDTTIPLESFLSHNSILSYKPWGVTTNAVTKMALKFMPNTTTSWDKSISWAKLPQDARKILSPVLHCVFLGNFRHAAFRPDIVQRLRILTSSVDELLLVANNDPLVISKAIMECITYVLEKQGFADTDDLACKRYMRQTVGDCDWLLRLAVAQQRPVTKSDIRFASKSHEPVFSREHRKMIRPTDLENKIMEAAARALSYKLVTKEMKQSVKFCIYARIKNKTFVEKLRISGFSDAAYRHCRAVVKLEMNQKKAFKRIAHDLKVKFPQDALIMCKLYASLPSVQCAVLHPLDINTYRKQRAVAEKNLAHRRHYYICLVCLTVDIPVVAGWRKEKRFYSDIEDGGRVYCPHCEGMPSVVKICLMGVRLQLMDNSYMLCTECLEPDVFSSAKINLQGFFVCKKCIHHKKTTPIWPKIDKRHLRGREIV